MPLEPGTELVDFLPLDPWWSVSHAEGAHKLERITSKNDQPALRLSYNMEPKGAAYVVAGRSFEGVIDTRHYRGISVRFHGMGNRQKIWFGFEDLGPSGREEYECIVVDNQPGVRQIDVPW